MMKKQNHVIWIEIHNIEYIEQSSIVYIKTNDIYKDIAEDVEGRFDASNYE